MMWLKIVVGRCFTYIEIKYADKWIQGDIFSIQVSLSWFLFQKRWNCRGVFSQRYFYEYLYSCVCHRPSTLFIMFIVRRTLAFCLTMIFSGGEFRYVHFLTHNILSAIACVNVCMCSNVLKLIIINWTPKKLKIFTWCTKTDSIEPNPCTRLLISVY